MRTDRSGGGRTPRENSLRLNERDLGRLVHRMNASGDPGSLSREHVRWDFANTHVELTVDQPGGSRQTIVVATRNLSRRGVGVLHSAYVYPGSQCELCFTLDNNERVVVRGEVTRCGHIAGRVHEVGVRLESEISTKDILGLDPMLEAYSLENVEPENLRGSVLVMAGSELERQLLVGTLSETELQILVAGDVAGAKEQIGKGVDLLLCDSFLENGQSGIELVAELRGSGFDAPVVVMGSANAGEQRDDIRMSGANGFLSKPVSGKRVMQALAEFLLGGGDGGPIYTSLAGDDSLNELISAFLRELPRLALSLEQAMRENDVAEALRVCRVLHGTSEPLGYGELSGLAAAAERSLTDSESIRAGGSDLRSLVIACRRVKFRKTG